ncbi:MAG: GNAT family N-acetyltransferase [Christensenellaceae bacterium]|jgi:RimJ/RimL family protein N-acetyltransferase
MKLFESDRIRLRKMTAEDIPLYHAWRTDMEVMRTTNHYLDMYDAEETRQFVEQVILNAPAAKNYMIIDKKEEKAIGITSLIQIDDKNRNAEGIIDIGEKDFWGKGYGKEALSLLLDYAFYEMNLHRVSLNVYAMNKRALALYEKLGFQNEGCAREALFREGR